MSDEPTESPGRAPTADAVRRFIFEHQPVRGHWVRLEATWRALRAHQSYPAPVRDLLGEAATAAVLLASTLKFEGTLTLQLQGDGAVRLLVAQCTNDFRLRAVARFDAARLPGGMGGPVVFRQLVGQEGRLTVTIEATNRDSRYQGVVPLSGESMAESLEAYFASSEQLPTQVRLIADEAATAGLLVQKLPAAGEGEAVEAAWNAAQRGAAGVEPASLRTQTVEVLLEQAFPDRDVRLFRGAPVQFECRCSAERVGSVLRSLGEPEVRDILREQGAVSVTCEFCQRPYRFDPAAVDDLFTSMPSDGGPASLH